MRAGYERARVMTRPREGLQLGCVLLGVVLAFMTAFVLSGVVGLVMYQGWLSEVYSPLVMNIVSFFCLFLGALYAGRRAGVLGLVHGGLTGLLYIIAVSILGLFLFDQLAPLLVLAQRTVFAVLLGAVGGTVGINIGR
jgi:putative membrane protein (TIGR04086 family)